LAPSAAATGQRFAITVGVDDASANANRATATSAGRGTRANAKTAGLPEHSEVSSIALVFADDARANVRVARACRHCERAGRSHARDVRASAVLLLSATHPADSPRGVHRVADSRGIGESVVVRQSPDDESTGAGGIHVESAVAVSRVGDRGRGVVCAVPVVCARSRGEWERGVAVLVS